MFGVGFSRYCRTPLTTRAYDQAYRQPQNATRSTI
jgi:hypothetical protein